MYFDLEDHRPDIPRVPSIMSRQKAVALSLVAHALVALGILFFPNQLFRAAHALNPFPRQEPVRFVELRPIVDKSKMPIRPAVQSDKDRRSATRERIPRPENPDPVSRGNTSEKIEKPPPDKSNGADATPPGTPPSAPPDIPAKVLPDVPTIIPAPAPSAGGLGDTLRNLKRYLQDQRLDNPKGGQTDKDSDIQFDSKGVDFGAWILRFKAQVEHNWIVPEAAMFFKGHVVIQFFVEKDGRITELRISQPSPIDGFNGPALNALKLSNPTMPLPAEYPSERAFFTVTFHYNEIRD
jgi:TonB family protein